MNRKLTILSIILSIILLSISLITKLGRLEASALFSIILIVPILHWYVNTTRNNN